MFRAILGSDDVLAKDPVRRFVSERFRSFEKDVGFGENGGGEVRRGGCVDGIGGGKLGDGDQVGFGIGIFCMSAFFLAGRGSYVRTGQANTAHLLLKG